MGRMFERIAEKTRSILRHILKYKIFYLLPDEIYLKIMYRLNMGRPLNLKKPAYFNEKLQWLKLYYRNPMYTTLADKYAARKHVADMIGEKYLIPLIGIWDRFDEIDFDSLPDQFVLKCTHNSGGVIVCQSKNVLDIRAVGRQFKKQLKRNYYYLHREWSYKNIKPRILCEKLISSKNGGLPMDYKFHCFNGQPDSVMICSDRQSGNTKFYYFDRNWELLKYNNNGIQPNDDMLFPRPSKLDEMFELASSLSRGIPYVRVDLYFENDEIYFGEMTFYSDAGFDSKMLKETDLLFGNKLDLSSIQMTGQQNYDSVL
jgi:hypothetical protein